MSNRERLLVDAAKKHAVVMRSIGGGSSQQHREAVEREAQTSEGREALIKDYGEYQARSDKHIKFLENADRIENGTTDNKGWDRS